MSKDIKQNYEKAVNALLFISKAQITGPTYYLKHEHACFIRYKTWGTGERFISDKARISSVLNSFCLQKLNILVNPANG